MLVLFRRPLTINTREERWKVAAEGLRHGHTGTLGWDLFTTRSAGLFIHLLNHWVQGEDQLVVARGAHIQFTEDKHNVLVIDVVVIEHEWRGSDIPSQIWGLFLGGGMRYQHCLKSILGVTG